MINLYVIYFIILSFIGYIYESLAMTIWIGKWDNRGFLFGPVIPIYGAGALIGTLLFEYLLPSYTPMQVFFIGMAGSAILEYSVHYSMEKLFHAYWWDYSKAPLNLNGRICLPATIGFGIAALIIIYGINPILLPFLLRMNAVVLQILSLTMIMVLSADLTLTVSVLSGFENRVEAMDSFINEHMNALFGMVLNEDKAINQRFYSTMDKFDESRKRLINDRIEKTISSMDNSYQIVLSKVKGFRGKNSKRLNYMLKRIKDKFVKAGEKDE